jgi:hypothetical protein
MGVRPTACFLDGFLDVGDFWKTPFSRQWLFVWPAPRFDQPVPVSCDRCLFLPNGAYVQRVPTRSADGATLVGDATPLVPRPDRSSFG